MKYVYDIEPLKTFLKSVIHDYLKPEGWSWLDKEATSIQNNNDIARFNIAFVAMPRKTGKGLVLLSADMEKKLQTFRPGMYLTGWSIDRLSRAFLLLHLNSNIKEKYCGAIENLFLNAEMSEQVALYSALPLLAYQEAWKKRCAEGIRSNISQVLESIICNNPYPAEQLEEAAWNQLVLKAIFTEKPILKIVGIHKRMNQNLAHSLSDYAHERWAANRTLNPLLWMCVSPFINEKNFPDIQRIFNSENSLEQAAAALACYESGYGPAKLLLKENEEIKNKIEKGEISWSSVARNMEKIENQ